MTIKRITNSDISAPGSSGDAMQLHRETVIVLTDQPDGDDKAICLERIGNDIQIFSDADVVLDPVDCETLAEQLQQIAHGGDL